MDEFVFVERDDGNGKTKEVKVPVRVAKTHDDIEAASHPKAEGVLLTIAGTRHGLPMEQALALQAALATAITEAQLAAELPKP